MKFLPDFSPGTVVLALTGVFCSVLVAPIHAKPINPWDPGDFLPDPFNGCLGCTLMPGGSLTQTVISSNGTFEATLNAAVFMDPNPIPGVRVNAGLDFFYQITNVLPCTGCSSGPINISTFTAMDFSATSVDIGINVGSVPGFVSFPLASAIPGAVNRLSPGATIGWSYDTPGSIALAPGTTSIILEVETSATNFTTGGLASAVGGVIKAPQAASADTANFQVFQPVPPVPEPASAPLIGAGMLALGCLRRYRRI